MVLHDISNDSNIVKVAATSFCAEWLFESDLHVCNVLTTPRCAEEGICEPEDEEIFDHFLSEVMIDAEGLVSMET